MDRRELTDDLQESIRMAMDGRISSVWTAFPGIITKVDFAKMTCEVQPAIQGIIEDAEGNFKNVNLPLLVDVPITFPSAGGFTLTFPIKADDEVLVIIANRCIDSWWQSGGIRTPAEARMHDLSDGFAIPGPKSQPKVIANISSENAQLRNDSGDTYVEITPGGNIKLISTTTVEIESPNVKIEGDLEVTGKVDITGETNITGATKVMGALETTGAITAPSVSIGGVPFATHRHTGVTTGPGTSGGPV